MKRRAVVIGTVLFCALAMAVFKIEYKVRALRSELGEVNRQILQNYEDIHVLKTEWVYLNQPQRIKELASRYLDMDYVNYAQLTNVDHIPAAPIMISQKKGTGPVAMARAYPGGRD
jgi:cell division protein FtsL